MKSVFTALLNALFLRNWHLSLESVKVRVLARQLLFFRGETPFFRVFKRKFDTDSIRFPDPPSIWTGLLELSFQIGASH